MSTTTTMSMMNHTMDHSDNHTMDHGDHGDHGDDMVHMMTMQMYFYLSSSVTILFSEWTTDTWEELLGSCAGVFVLAVLYEGLKVFREVLLARTHRYTPHNATITPTGSNSSKNSIIYTDASSPSIRRSMLSCAHVVQSLLHVIQVSVSYLLMLVVMTYNGWLFISVATGAGVGYFLFAWKRAVVMDVNEHCN